MRHINCVSKQVCVNNNQPVFYRYYSFIDILFDFKIYIDFIVVKPRLRPSGGLKTSPPELANNSYELT